MLRPNWRIVCETGSSVSLASETREIRLHGRSDLVDALTRYFHNPSEPLAHPASESVIARLRDEEVWIEPAELRTFGGGHLDRLLAYFACFTERPRNAVVRLIESRVLILGLGGTGSVVLQNLVGCGIRDYTLVDADLVEISNLNRQLIYSRRDIGKEKVSVARTYVCDRLPNAEVRAIRSRLLTAGDLAPLIDSDRPPNLVVVAIDEPIESIVGEVTQELAVREIPYIVGGVGVTLGSAGTVQQAVADDRTFVSTTASISTTNSMGASRTAHRVVEFLSGLALPYTER